MKRSLNGGTGLVRVAAIVLGAGALAGGCSAPQGQSGGRVPVSEGTRGELQDRRIMTSDLAESSDRVAESLARDIQQIVDEDFGGYRATITFGDIQNKTGNVSTTDFEYVRDRIKSKLMTSRHVRDNVRFRESRRRVEDLNQRELGRNDDLLSEGGGTPTGIRNPNPDFLMYLNGNMYRVERGRGSTTDLYYLKFELIRASDGITLFSQDYEVKYGSRP